MKILIDGYNLKIPQGSGIKYYTIKLIELLSQNNELATLFGFNIKAENEKLKSAEFYNKLLLGENFKKKSFILSLLNNKTEFIQLNDLVIEPKDKYLLNTKIYNHPFLFEKANLKSKFGISHIISIDADIFHVTYPLNIEIKNKPKITTIHDVIPLKVPYVSLENKNYFYNLIKNTIKQSKKIITVSDASKKDILEFFDVDENKVVNTYQSVSLPKITSYHLDENNLQKFELKKEKYLLFVGNIEPKKNLGRVLEAFNNIDTDKKLVIVGRKAWMWENELKYFNKSNMKLLSYVSRTDLVLLYKNAFGFIFPSLYEGFGLPPLEAMACGCPVITSNTSSLPEVCEDGAIYCDPFSVNSIKNAIEKLLNLSANERKELIQKGYKRVEFFNDKDYENRVLEVYKSVL